MKLKIVKISLVVTILLVLCFSFFVYAGKQSIIPVSLDSQLNVKEKVTQKTQSTIDTTEMTTKVYTIQNQLDFGEAIVQDHEIMFLPYPNQYGEGEILVQVSDGINRGYEKIFVEVKPENLHQDDPINYREPIRVDVLNKGNETDITDIKFPFVTGFNNQLKFSTEKPGVYHYLYTLWDGITNSKAFVRIKVSKVNYIPVALPETINGVVGMPLTVDVLRNDYDVNGDTITIQSVSSGVFGGTGIIVTPENVGKMKVMYTISDGEFESSAYVTINVLEKDDSHIYISFGDSLANGNSFERSTIRLFNNAYPLQISEYMRSKHENAVYFDNHVSGDNAVEIYEHLKNDGIRTIVEAADVITICVGANDLMDSAPRRLIGPINFYSLDWDKAAEGRENFETNWPKIVHEINVLNPDVQLFVMTLYNTYSYYDEKHNTIEHPIYSDWTLHEVVDYFLWNDTPDFYGMNYVIANTETLYETYENYETSLELDYRVIDLYTDAETNYRDNKGEILAFYDNYIQLLFWRIPIQDPHPTQAGQNRIFKLFKNAYNRK